MLHRPQSFVKETLQAGRLTLALTAPCPEYHCELLFFLFTEAKKAALAPRVPRLVLIRLWRSEIWAWQEEEGRGRGLRSEGGGGGRPHPTSIHLVSIFPPPSDVAVWAFQH